MHDLLPVGSVVSIKGFDKLYIVCASDSTKENEYILAPYPIGLTQFFLVREEKKENIEKVYFVGYMDKASYFEMFKNRNEEKADGVE